MKPDCIELEQTYMLEEFPTLRDHAIKVAMFQVDGTKLEVKSVTLKNDEPLTVVSCGSMDKVKAVLPNYNDYSFLRIELDKPSIDFFM